MDWGMMWKEMAIGFVIAGFLAVLVPNHAWRALFLTHDRLARLRLLENVVVGPLIAVASFVCSIGNIPLASILWSGGISFGGVISFIYADLIIVPLIIVYGKYYGARAAAYITRRPVRLYGRRGSDCGPAVQRAALDPDRAAPAERAGPRAFCLELHDLAGPAGDRTVVVLAFIRVRERKAAPKDPCAAHRGGL